MKHIEKEKKHAPMNRETVIAIITAIGVIILSGLLAVVIWVYSGILA